MATIAGQKNLNEDSYGKILLKPVLPTVDIGLGAI
jgi:hypothetical protein